MKSKPPKLSPITVTDDPPLGAEFSNPYDNTAASKDSSPRHVPTSIATVSSRFAFRGPPTAGEMGVTRQYTVVADVQLVVTQEKLFAAAVTVAFCGSNERPVIVNDPAPVCGTFKLICDPTGASNVSSTQSVPAAAPTVSTDGEPDPMKLID